MHAMHLRQLDLNLLPVLDALLAERSVTRAARRLGLSQPATSHALARLRSALGDPLLVRTPRGMRMTPHAEAIAGDLRRALADLESAVAPAAAFDASRARRGFRVATDDYCEFVLLPALLSRIDREAPGVDLHILRLTGREGADLAEGHVDAVIGIVEVLGPLPGAYTQRLFDERFVCLVRKGHPLVGRRLSLATFAGLRHALVAPRGDGRGVVDAALAKLGLDRRVSVQVPHFLVAPQIVRASDVILTVGERLARAAAPSGLRIFPPPLALPGFTVSLIWHGRNHADPGHAWFRNVAAEVGRAL